MANTLVNRTQQRPQGITAFLSNEAVKRQINDVVGGKDGQKFITAVVSAVNTNPALQQCTNTSIFCAALLGQSLNLPMSPQLGYYYLVPFKNNKANTTEAQFQLGYKGMIQMAIRTGQFKKINVMAIKQGELEYFDPMNEEIKVNLMINEWDKREQLPTVGYYCFFELINGFRKAIYWSKNQMEAHAMKYSKGYAAKKGYTFWEKDFDAMAYKTMLRQILSKWAPMSLEMQTAIESDGAVIREDGSKEFLDDGYIIDAAQTVEDKEPVSQAKAQPNDDFVKTSSNPADALFG